METAHSRLLSDSQNSLTSSYLDFKNQEAALKEIKKNGGETFLKTLACVKSFFRDGELHFRNITNGEMEMANRVIFVQKFSKTGKCLDNWLTPFCDEPTGKNKLEFKTNKNNESEACLSDLSKGFNLDYEEIRELKINGTLEQRYNQEREINTVFSVENLKKLI